MGTQALKASEWIESETGSNAQAVATRAAPSGGLSHHITSISASFEASVVGAVLTLSQGATEIGRWHVHDAFGMSFPAPIKVAAGVAVSATLAASGSAGVDGTVVITGYTL